MGRTPSRTNKKTSESRGENGKKPQSLTEGINEQVNAAEEKVQEIEKRGKPKRGKIAELTKQLEEAAKRAEEAEKKIEQLQAESAQKSEGIQILNDNLRDQTQAYKNRIAELEDSNKVYINGAKSLINRKKEADEKNERLSKNYQDALTQNSILTESIRQSALKSPKEVDQARKELESLEPKAEEVKTDNSGTTEETVTPKTSEAKVEGEPEVKTEQATQEPKNEAKQTSTESSEMTPEEAYEYLSDKKNFKEANTYFSSGKDSYIGTNGKHLPKSWFDVYNGNKASDHSMFRSPNNKDVFTASLKEKGLLEDPKKEPSRKDTVSTLAEADAKRKFDEWIDSKGNKFRGIFGKHKVLYSSLLGIGSLPAIMKGIDAIGDWYVNKAIEDNHVSDEAFFGESDDNEDFNGEPTEPGNVAEKVANAAQETAQADNTAEEQAAQALQENLPQGVAGLINQKEGESPVATNASTPASAKASTAKPASTQDTTQGLPPVVTRDAPSTNPNSSGMTYSQRVEAAGQAPQAGSMAYNANNPDMVTAGLIDAMNQNSQVGSDAIGYGDLYDQNFIDFWAKRNPNLAYAVSQGRR